MKRQYIMDNFSETEIMRMVVENSPEIARIILKDHNCEIRKDHKEGIKILEVVRKQIK